MVYSCKRDSHGVYRQIGDFPHPFIAWDEPAFTIAKFRLVPFSTSPHTAEGRPKSLCVLLVPSLRRKHNALATKRAQRGTKFFRVGAPPQTPDPERDPLTRKGELMVSYRHARQPRQIQGNGRQADCRGAQTRTQDCHRQYPHRGTCHHGQHINLWAKPSVKTSPCASLRPFAAKQH